MGLVDQGGQEVPAASEVVASEEAAAAAAASEVVSRVDVEEVAEVASRVETDSRLEEAADPEVDSASREATEAPTATVAEDTMAAKPHRTHRQDPEDAEEVVGMAVATTEVPVEGTKADLVGMVIGAVEATNAVAGPEGMTATAVTEVVAGAELEVTGMATAMVPVPVPVPVLALVLALVLEVEVEVAEGLVDIEATTTGVVDPTVIGERTVIGVLMAIGVRTVIAAATIGAATEATTGIRESVHTKAATEGMVVAIGTGEGISSVVC